MADQELKIIIKSLFDNAGTNKSLGDLRLLVQATENGSKEAAAALDKWRSTYGKLRTEMGGSLASSPGSFMNPPPGPQDAHIAAWRTQQINLAARAAANKPPIIAPPVIPGADEASGMGYGMRRHLGALGGQLLGLPGLGIAAGVGGVGAIVGGVAIGLQKVVQLMNEWNDQLMRFAMNARAFGDIDREIGSIAQHTQKLNIENNQFNIGLANIERNVNNAASAVKHYLSMLELQLAYQGKLDEADQKRIASQIALRNAFNPFENARQQQANTEAFDRRRLEREREADQIRLKALGLQERLATGEKEYRQEQIANLDPAIAAQRREAEAKEAGLKATEKANEEIIQQLKQERVFVEQMASGSIVPGFGLTGYLKSRTAALAREGPSNLDIAVSGNAGPLALGYAQTVQGVAQARAKEIDQKLAALDSQKKVAEMQVETAKGDQNGLETLKAEQQEKLKQAEQRQLEAQRDSGQLKREVDAKKQAQDDLLRSTIDTEKSNLQLQQLHLLPQANPGTSTGGADATQILKDILDTNQKTMALTQMIYNQWAA